MEWHRGSYHRCPLKYKCSTTELPRGALHLGYYNAILFVVCQVLKPTYRSWKMDHGDIKCKYISLGKKKVDGGQLWKRGHAKVPITAFRNCDFKGTGGLSGRRYRCDQWCSSCARRESTYPRAARGS